mmetsp:Transcript_13787/g.31989  ORF Transcript_13787/g.31989 Transcript_13787/m.31989 type:complete len:212 (-) Transcript_13787:1782-2417(-)
MSHHSITLLSTGSSSERQCSISTAVSPFLATVSRPSAVRTSTSPCFSSSWPNNCSLMRVWTSLRNVQPGSKECQRAAICTQRDMNSGRGHWLKAPSTTSRCSGVNWRERAESIASRTSGPSSTCSRCTRMKFSSGILRLWSAVSQPKTTAGVSGRVESTSRAWGGSFWGIHPSSSPPSCCESWSRLSRNNTRGRASVPRARTSANCLTRAW